MANETHLDRVSGWYGDDFITGITEFTCPSGKCISSFNVRSGGATIASLKKDAAYTVVAANVESSFKNPALVLEASEWTVFNNDITKMTLTNAADGVHVWFRPLRTL